MTLPEVDREVCVIAPSLTAALTVTAEDIGALWTTALEAIDLDALRIVNRNTPREHSVDLHVADHDGSRVLTLWLGETRLARLQR